MYKKINKCRVCGNNLLDQILNLGDQALTGVFPSSNSEKITTGPLSLIKCQDINDSCGLLQLEYSFDINEMYGENYGYRSGLNSSMIEHLHAKVKKILDMVNLKPGDLVIDIGSNDSTTLQAYPTDLLLIGIDPTGPNFLEFYPPHIKLIPEFFSSSLVKKLYPTIKAKIITSFSMFYDLESPFDFMKNIYEILDEDGIWIFEQSYMPRMLEMNSYDTICHEHLEYYGLKQIKWMTDRIGLQIEDVEFNDINGGSFSIVVRKTKNEIVTRKKIQDILNSEEKKGLSKILPYKDFLFRIRKISDDLVKFVHDIKILNKSIYAIGASTKGNVILQYCHFTDKDIPFVGEVNSAKFDCFTPGSLIPIISEIDLLAKQPDYLLILPWHFSNFFENNPKFNNFNLVFPLPSLRIREKIS
jgi:hypothetical protein